MEKIRYHLLDGWRGFLLINMIAYHAIWDLVYLYESPMPWYTGNIGNLWQRFICISFILLSGFCFHFSSNRLKRGLTVFLGGVLVTAVTMVVLPAMPALFGVLTLIGSCMMIAVPLNKLFLKIPPIIGAVSCLILYIIFYNVDNGSINLFFDTVRVPKNFYANHLTAYFGFPYHGFASSDYFPIFPWIFIFFMGYFLNMCIKEHLHKARFLRFNIPFLSFIGKHSLLIYLVHQPLIYVLLMLL